MKAIAHQILQHLRLRHIYYIQFPLFQIVWKWSDSEFLRFAKTARYLHYMEVSWCRGIFYGSTKSHKEVHGAIHSRRNSTNVQCAMHRSETKEV